MASDREKKIAPPERRTGRFQRGGGAPPRSKSPGRNQSPDGDEPEDEKEPAEAEAALDENEKNEDAGDENEKGEGKAGRTSSLLLPAKGKKKRKKAATEEVPTLELEPITEFPRSFSIGVKFAGLSAVVVAFFMVFLGYLTYSITLREVDEQITQKGVSAARSLEKGLDKTYWVVHEDEIKKTIEALGMKEAKDVTKQEVTTFWQSQKAGLEKQWGANLNDLVNASGGQILAAAIIEKSSVGPAGVALSSKEVKLTNPSFLGTIGKPDSPERVEVREAYLESVRVRQFDKPVVDPATGQTVHGMNGDAWVSLFVSAAKIDEVQDAVKQRIMIVTAIGAVAGILLTILIAAFLTRPIRELERDIAAVAEGDLEHETEPSSRDEIGALAHTFNIMTRNLKAAQSNAANQKALERELAIATEIQTKLLPERLPQIPGLDIHSFYLSAKEVGGDYYDFIVIDQTHLGIIVADVSGKGIPGSMVMTMARSLVRLASVRNVSPSDTFKKVNRILAKDIRRGMFVTSIYMVLNVKTHELKVASAGHNPLVVFRAGTGEIELVKPQGIALGFDKGTIFDNHIQEVELKLEPGDRIVAYTDGVNEAMNAESEEFGDERFQDLVKKHARLPSKDCVNKIVEALEEHRGGAEQSDDITITTLCVVK